MYLLGPQILTMQLHLGELYLLCFRNRVLGIKLNGLQFLRTLRHATARPP